MKAPKAPKKTQEQVATERRQQFMLDEEIDETEGRLKAVARGKLGKTSLLASGAGRRGGASKGSSMLSGGGVSGGGRAPSSGSGGGGSHGGSSSGGMHK
jgi:hypothetical protein